MYDAQGELLREFESVEEALKFAVPLSRIPGNSIGLIIYVGERPVDVMRFWA